MKEMFRKKKWCDSGADFVSQTADIARSAMEAAKIYDFVLYLFQHQSKIEVANRVATT